MNYYKKRKHVVSIVLFELSWNITMRFTITLTLTAVVCGVAYGTTKNPFQCPPGLHCGPGPVKLPPGFTPGSPEEPVTSEGGSYINPGGPEIPASWEGSGSGYINPGGPEIPASGEGSGHHHKHHRGGQHGFIPFFPFRPPFFGPSDEGSGSGSY
ncbi:unnamed protein product [Bursaphelenchus okinawaensis]|uniref:Uncharacterized protein n=1 Tax=Bursaphelenchus okinawaensis TaxID=465554 RepID=A0A811KB30_9BILA|nr:unnamed protein product [Bursaphelenchus okinawaensis]CAG9097253.1 unnamed protein product [Bursaphelenchus okinawaensis]